MYDKLMDILKRERLMKVIIFAEVNPIGFGVALCKSNRLADGFIGAINAVGERNRKAFEEGLKRVGKFIAQNENLVRKMFDGVVKAQKAEFNEGGFV